MPEDTSLIYQIERIHNEGPTKSFKLLGVLFDEILSFEPHIALVCSKVSKALFCINRIKNFIHQKSLISLYYAMIHSLSSQLLLECTVYGCANTTNLQKEAIQMFCHAGYQ
jgi:hypothetical protein